MKPDSHITVLVWFTNFLVGRTVFHSTLSLPMKLFWLIYSLVLSMAGGLCMVLWAEREETAWKCRLKRFLNG